MKIYKSVAALLASIMLIPVILSGCAQRKPEASLHSPGENGYIEVSSDQLSLLLSSPQAFVYDVEADELIYTCGSGEVLYPASTTKLLCILYALTLMQADELVTPGDELSLLGENSTIAYIKAHHTLTVEMLVEGMLLPSGNDAAYALAAAAGRKLSADANISGQDAVRLFLDGMNDYADELGLCGSSFTSPDGYYDDSHYTTVEDMALVSALAAKNELIMKYAGLHSDNVVYESGHTNEWINTNLMLDSESEYFSPYATGLKTGSAGKGNYSLIVTVDIARDRSDKRDGEGEYIIGLFSGKNEDERYHDALTIINELIKRRGI